MGYKAVKFDQYGDRASDDDVLLVFNKITTLFPGLNISRGSVGMEKDVGRELTKDIH